VSRSLHGSSRPRKQDPGRRRNALDPSRRATLRPRESDREQLSGLSHALDNDSRRRIRRDRDNPDGDFMTGGQYPYVTGRRGGFLYNLLEGREGSSRAASGGERRSMNFASRIRNGRVLLDVDKLALEENQDWILVLGYRPSRGKSARDIEPFGAAAATPPRCGNSTSRKRPLLSSGFVSAGSKGRCPMARCRYAAAIECVWRGHGDHLRLRQNRQAVAARHRT